MNKKNGIIINIYKQLKIGLILFLIVISDNFSNCSKSLNLFFISVKFCHLDLIGNDFNEL